MAELWQIRQVLGHVINEYECAIVGIYPNGERTIFARDNHAYTGVIEEFQQHVQNAHYEHVALIARDHVMAIWHRDSKAAAPAQPIAAFDVGDLVTIKPDVGYPSLAVEKRRWQAGRNVGVILSINHRIKVGFHDGGVEYDYFFEADELTLWTPAEPGSDAPNEYTRDEEQARLIARIRELEEALETIANLNVRPDMFTAADAGVKAQRIASEALAEAQEERG